MSNASLVSISSADLDNVAGGGSLLPPNRVGTVLSTLGHTEESIAAVARRTA